MGTIFEIDHRNTRHDLWAFSLKKYLKLKPNIFLYWETLQDATNKGIEYYDFGRSVYGNSTYLFKKRWLSYPVRLNYSLVDLQPETPLISNIRPMSGGLIPKMWALMPDLITNKIGPELRRFIY